MRFITSGYREPTIQPLRFAPADPAATARAIRDGIRTELFGPQAALLPAHEDLVDELAEMVELPSSRAIANLLRTRKNPAEALLRKLPRTPEIARLLGERLV